MPDESGAGGVTNAEFEREALEAMRDADATGCEIVHEVEGVASGGSLEMVSRVPVIGIRCTWRGKQMEMTTMRKSPALDAVTRKLTLDGIRRSLR